MTQKLAKLESVRCYILLSNTARLALTEHVSDEHAFFNLQQNFLVHIEKVSVDDKQHITFYFDDEKNPKLQQKFPGRIVIIDCVFDKKDGLIAKSFRTRGKGTPVATNRRKAMKINFVASRISGHTYSPKFIELIDSLPVAQERFDYVNKRISSWEGYLKVLDKNAAIEDIQCKFSHRLLNGEATHMTVTLNGLDQKQWKQLKGLAVRMRGFKHDIGEVSKVNRGAREIEIELKPDMAKLARKNELKFEHDDIEFTNAATKSQLKRLLKGFERLKEGLAANANLETILFEDKPKIAERKQNVELDFHNPLNPFQREAVIGAMSAEDLYVIQGPPGTGKTTVISEICYQNAKAGLKTLVASQSNLAVDNALSRLLSNKDIRILRYGRTESIEEEGKKFIEENVADYWKQQTYQTISYEIDHYESKEQQLKDEVKALETEIETLQQQNIQLQQQIIDKEKAEKQLKVINNDILELRKQLTACKKERDENERMLAKLKQSFLQYDESVKAFQRQLDDFPTEQQLINDLTLQTKQFKQYTLELEAAEVKQVVDQYMHRLSATQQELAKVDTSNNTQDTLEEKIDSLKKVHEVEDFMVQYGLRRSYVMDRLLTSMEKIQPELERFKNLTEVTKRLEKAITYSETTLGIYVQPEQLPTNHQYTINEVDEFLTKLSRAFAQKIVTPANGRRSILGLHIRKQYLAQQQEKYDEYIREVLLIFSKFKLEIKKQLQQLAGANEAQIQQLRDDEQRIKLQYEAKQQEFLAYNIPSPRAVSVLQQLRIDADDEVKRLTILQQDRLTIAQKLTLKQKELEQLKQQILAGEELLEQLAAQWKDINSSGIALEKTKQHLEQITAQNPEAALASNEQKIERNKENITKLSEKIAMIPITEQLQRKWKGMLEKANEHDLDEIRKLYVKHANVIGTTCVASANKEFMENYPTFDVVIIDEVSKATPPELLLPMLKGTKIILVGDHHQLPPLIGDETFEETLEQVMKDSNTFEEKRELEKLLEESLFERLYKNLPTQNKQMLAIQYRMHENIMASIAPFYANENDALQCGLADSDAMRDHKLETSHIHRQDHLLWMDIPNERAYFEERMKEGSSLYNESELNVIKEMLQEVNDATALLKKNGEMGEDDLKSVGVISFYAEQVKRINRLIEQEMQLPHLHIRTGSVDKFQGMEMDLIFVSMVRNNDNKHGDIGFAKDYRRLNVALSRARELLVLIGSTDMFTKRPKHERTRQMYSRLLQTVKQQQGYRQAISVN